MTKRPATPFVIDDPSTSLGVVAMPVGLAAAEGDTQAPEWIQIAPRGRVEARDGRSFQFNPESLVARFTADAIDIPVDLDHSAAYGFTEAKVVGWIDRLEARADGLYGRVDWLDEGRSVLAARKRRYVSPSIRHNEDGTATWIHSVALVAAPALSMPALASADLDQPAKDTSMKTIAVALGLAEASSEAAILSTLNARLAGSVDKAVHDQALVNLTAASTRVKDLETQLGALATAGHKAKVDAVLDAALKEKRLVPAQREQFAALAATPEGLTQVEAILKASPAALGASGLDGLQPPEGGDVPIAVAAAQLAAEINTYIGEQAKAGVIVDPVTALQAIQARKAKA